MVPDLQQLWSPSPSLNIYGPVPLERKFVHFAGRPRTPPSMRSERCEDKQRQHNIQRCMHNYAYIVNVRKNVVISKLFGMLC